ncbi:MAG: ferrous iron transport protein A [Saprospiraceae bacterium]
MQDNTKSLSSLVVGETATITHFSNPQVGCKLIAMGVAPKCDISVVRRSFMGNTIYIKSGNSQFAIRKKEAAFIFVK